MAGTMIKYANYEQPLLGPDKSDEAAKTFKRLLDEVIEFVNKHSFLHTLAENKTHNEMYQTMINTTQIYEGIRDIMKQFDSRNTEGNIAELSLKTDESFKEHLRNSRAKITAEQIPEALIDLNKALLHVPVPNPDLPPYQYSLLLWQRSDILTMQKKYLHAIYDLEQIYVHTFPRKLLQVYYRKLAALYLWVGQNEKANAVYSRALRMYRKGSNEHRRMRHLMNETIKPNPSPAYDGMNEDDDDDYGEPILNHEVVVTQGETGTCLQATNMIDIGQLIMDESPLACYIIPEAVHLICCCCNKISTAPYFCHSCTYVGYCSIECRDKAKPGHIQECNIYGIMRAANLSIDSFIGLKLITQIDLNTIKEIYKQNTEIFQPENKVTYISVVKMDDKPVDKVNGISEDEIKNSSIVKEKDIQLNKFKNYPVVKVHSLPAVVDKKTPVIEVKDTPIDVVKNMPIVNAQNITAVKDKDIPLLEVLNEPAIVENNIVGIKSDDTNNNSKQKKLEAIKIALAESLSNLSIMKVSNDDLENFSQQFQTANVLTFVNIPLKEEPNSDGELQLDDTKSHIFNLIKQKMLNESKAKSKRKYNKSKVSSMKSKKELDNNAKEDSTTNENGDNSEPSNVTPQDIESEKIALELIEDIKYIHNYFNPMSKKRGNIVDVIEKKLNIYEKLHLESPSANKAGKIKKNRKSKNKKIKISSNKTENLEVKKTSKHLIHSNVENILSITVDKVKKDINSIDENPKCSTIKTENIEVRREIKSLESIVNPKKKLTVKDNITVELKQNNVENPISDVKDNITVELKQNNVENPISEAIKPEIVEPKTSNGSQPKTKPLTIHEKYSYLYKSGEQKLSSTPKDFLIMFAVGVFIRDRLVGSLKRNDNENEDIILHMLVHNLSIVRKFIRPIVNGAVNMDRRTSGTVNIGFGLYTCASVFSQDCYPNVARYFEGTRIVMRSIREIGFGERLTDAYMGHFLDVPWDVRKRFMSQYYGFECDCEPCFRGWPTYSAMSANKHHRQMMLRCLNSKCPRKFLFPGKSFPKRCPTCFEAKNKERLLKHRNVMLKLKNRVLNAKVLARRKLKVEEAIDWLEFEIKRAHAISAPPQVDLHKAEITLKALYSIRGLPEIESNFSL